eukprot:CAMPEP_0198287434 /NCGR_PEP_ID=MMETSP1449-20131203/6249_1 /TAXON_ID=420275 /ORGANISM="Attheya septentrionalis, Strain CCMP2084" /LENGTH=1615 /DNA_ID=CAMNT_0043985387 /DNA_START=94 /DNA_END=4941 /DNA_ORIENTATION=-
MRWRSGPISSEASTTNGASSRSESQSQNATHSNQTRRIDMDEQDFGGSDNPVFDDDTDEDDHHRCDSAIVETSISGLAASASHSNDDFDESSGDMNLPLSQSLQRTASTSASMASALPPLPGGYAESLMSSSAMTPGGASAASAVVIEDDDDDPGLDHSVPPEENDGISPIASWRPQTQQSTCEFTHTITNYSQKRESGCKKAEYSSTTIDSFGNRWRLIVYVNGNGRASNHHLSLFLQVADADELPFGWKKAVSYVLTLEHPSENLGYAKRNPDKTFKLCPKAIDWGWSQFITSDRIQQEGYVSNDSLTVRASVTVKSSSVAIDPEDAELYLKCAVEEGNAEAVNTCLSQGAGVNCQFKDDLYTPLHTACSSSTSSGSLAVLNLLLEKGADGNACNKWRETPLLIAANNGHRAAVEKLLEKGADPSLCSEAGWSALTFAAHKGYDDIVSLLLEKGAPVNCRVTEDLSTPLHKACAGGKMGHLSSVKQLLNGGADVHALNKWSETPLLTAANHGQAAAVEALLQDGGDPCKCTDTGWSPLSIAAYKGHDDVVRLLLEEGAPTEEADPTLSALLQAATKGLPDTVELLLRHGADHTVTTKKGDTALSILVEQNLIDAAVEMVTEYKASVPRCSRDRKKVQRARLLINLRMKQQQREGILNGNLDSDDDDSDQDQSDDGSNSALHDSDSSPKAAAPGSIRKNKKKKKGKSKANAEAEARAAEEALLLELEMEDTQAKKDEAAATSKRAKKKKKRERERQVKLDEEKVQREKDEKEAKERERKQRVKEEKEKKERKLKEREIQEREEQEAAKRVKEAAAKQKQKDEREKRAREQEKKDRERSERLERKANEANATQLLSQASSTTGDKKVKTVPKTKLVKKQVTGDIGQKAKSIEAVVRTTGTLKGSGSTLNTIKTTSGKSRGWETKTSDAQKDNLSVDRKQMSQSNEGRDQFPVNGDARSISSLNNSSSHIIPPVEVHMLDIPVSPAPSHHSQSRTVFSVEDQLEDMANGVVDFLGFDTTPQNNFQREHQNNHGTMPVLQSDTIMPLNVGAPYAVHSGGGQLGSPSRMESHHNDGKSHYRAVSIDLPSVAIFQQEKVSELFQRCAISRSSQSSHADSLSAIDEHAIKNTIYRWIVRASHDQSQFADSIIPSWVDHNLLESYLQRQLIAESRRGTNGSTQSGMSSIEVFKEAGTSLAILCQHLAKELAIFRSKCEQQVPPDWSDSALNITASEMMGEAGSLSVVIDWAGRSQVYVPVSTFTNLRNRYRGPPSRLLTAIFSATKRYDTFNMIAAGTSLDCHLPPSTQECLSREASVSIELWTDPLSVYSSNGFCGVFSDVDSAFGGLRPFGSDDGVAEAAILKHGGSVSVLPPLESTTASLYVRKILDLLEKSQTNRVPLSFALFLPSACFREMNRAPNVNDLSLLDPRLGGGHAVFVRAAEFLPPGQHSFRSNSGSDLSEVSQTGSLFVMLQNEPGAVRFKLTDNGVLNILLSMSMNYDHPQNTLPGGFPGMSQDNFSMPPPSGLDQADLGLVGNMSSGSFARGGGHRGRLFDLVDDGDDDNANDVDVVSGMMGSLNVGLFQNTSSTQDVDIEAISLMGIGGSTLSGNNHGKTSGRFG